MGKLIDATESRKEKRNDEKLKIIQDTIENIKSNKFYIYRVVNPNIILLKRYQHTLRVLSGLEIQSNSALLLICEDLPKKCKFSLQPLGNSQLIVINYWENDIYHGKYINIEQLIHDGYAKALPHEGREFYVKYIQNVEEIPYSNGFIRIDRCEMNEIENKLYVDDSNIFKYLYMDFKEIATITDIESFLLTNFNSIKIDDASFMSTIGFEENETIDLLKDLFSLFTDDDFWEDIRCEDGFDLGEIEFDFYDCMEINKENVTKLISIINRINNGEVSIKPNEFEIELIF